MSKSKQRVYVQEASRLAEKRADGSFRVVLITEGTGSTGVYSADLMDNSQHVFENVASYMDHPIDPEAPHKRPVASIAGRFSNVEAEDGELGRQLAADFKPREEYRALFEEFGDLLGLSIFCGAYGEKDDTGRVVVEAFDDEDPYRSVDVVVAAGRGGRFKRAQESLRAIESSLGLPERNQPGSTSAPGTHTQEEHMDPELKALLEALTGKVDAALVELKAATDAARQAEADAKAAQESASDAVDTAVEALQAISDAELVDEASAPLIEAAKKGEDITAALEAAVKVKAAYGAPKSAVESFKLPSGYVIESAKPTDGDDDFRIGFGGSR